MRDIEDITDQEIIIAIKKAISLYEEALSIPDYEYKGIMARYANIYCYMYGMCEILAFLLDCSLEDLEELIPKLNRKESKKLGLETFPQTLYSFYYPKHDRKSRIKFLKHLLNHYESRTIMSSM